MCNTYYPWPCPGCRTTKEFRVCTELEKCVAAGLKEQVVHRHSIAHDQAVELMGQGKNNVVVCRGQQFGLFVGYPLVAFGSATVGAMAIYTAMKLVLFMPTD